MVPLFFFSYSPVSDVPSGARKQLQPRYEIEFHVLAHSARCSLYSSQIGEASAFFSPFSMKQGKNISEKQFGINLVYDGNSVSIYPLLLQMENTCMQP